jgi:integrase
MASFASFVNQKYNLSLDEVVKQLQSGKIDIYDLLSSYVAFIQKKDNVLSPLSIKALVSARKLKLKVRMPRAVRQFKEALTKEDIVNILNACSDIKLKTYCMFLAATGCRAAEAASTRLRDFDFNCDPPKVFIRGEYTKTRADRDVFLTKELVDQIGRWLNFKYRIRRVCIFDKKRGKWVLETRSPDRTKRMNDLVFSSSTTKDHRRISVKYLYNTLVASFEKTLDRMGGVYAQYEDTPENNSYHRHLFSLHTFRRWAKSTISDLGYSDFSEYYIGHAGSTYYRKSEKEKANLFRKIESSLTFLDFLSLERKGADVQSKIEVLEQENFTLRQRDSVNADAIQNLSDQLIKVMAEVQELKKR